MSKKLYEEDNISAIAAGIRYVNGGSDTYQTSQMPTAIRALKRTLINKSITENGNYNPASDNADGYSSVDVAVPSSIPDLETLSVTQNGTYTPSSGKDGFSEVSVLVPISTTDIYVDRRDPTYYMNYTGKLCTISDTSFYKYNDRPAYCAYVNLKYDQYYRCTPILVSTDSEAVKSNADYMPSHISGSDGTIVYNNETYYIGFNDYLIIQSYDMDSSSGFAAKLTTAIGKSFSECINLAAKELLDLVFETAAYPVIFKTNGIKQIPQGYDGFGALDIQVPDLAGFATVIYPKGLVCTATYTDDGIAQSISPDNTNGVWLFKLQPPKNFPITCTFSVVINNQTISQAITFYDYGESYSVVLTDQQSIIAFLKQEFAKTDYARLSNTIGDKVIFSNRGFIRTTDEPIIFINQRSRSSNYYSYSCIVPGNTLPAGTAISSSYGGLKNKQTYNIHEYEVCSGFMGGFYSSGKPKYYLDGDTTGIELSNDFSKPKVVSQTNSAIIECDDADELHSFMAKVCLFLKTVNESAYVESTP